MMKSKSNSCLEYFIILVFFSVAFIALYFTFRPLIAHHAAAVGIFLDNMSAFNGGIWSKFSNVPFYNYRPLYVVLIDVLNKLLRQSSVYSLYLIGGMTSTFMVFLYYLFLRQKEYKHLKSLVLSFLLLALSPVILFQLVRVEDNIVFYPIVTLLLLFTDSISFKNEEDEFSRMLLLSIATSMACFLHLLNVFLFLVVLLCIFLYRKEVKRLHFFINFFLFFFAGFFLLSLAFQDSTLSFFNFFFSKLEMLIFSQAIGGVTFVSVLSTVFKTLPLANIILAVWKVPLFLQCTLALIFILFVFYLLFKAYKKRMYFNFSFGLVFLFVTIMYEPNELQRWDFVWLFILCTSINFYRPRKIYITITLLTLLSIPNVFFVYKQRVDSCQTKDYCINELDKFLREKNREDGNENSSFFPSRFLSLNSQVLLNTDRPAEEVFFKETDECFQAPVSRYFGGSISRAKMLELNIVNNLPLSEDKSVYKVVCP